MLELFGGRDDSVERFWRQGTSMTNSSFDFRLSLRNLSDLGVSAVNSLKTQSRRERRGGAENFKLGTPLCGLIEPGT